MKVFIHIPKTGGTSLVQILSKQIHFKKFKRFNPKRTTHPKDFLAEISGKIEQFLLTKPDVEVVGGHFGFGAHQKLLDPASYFVILRNPVERVISEYYYMKYKGMYYQNLIEQENLSLVDYLNHPETYYLNNLQTRLISGVAYDSGDKVTQEIYEKALDNLKKFAAIGITESMAETLAFFYLTLGWTRLPYHVSSNINDQRPNRNTVAKEDAKAIGDRDCYDVMLYNKAKEIFNKSLADNREQIKPLIRKIKRPALGYKLYLKVIGKIRTSI